MIDCTKVNKLIEKEARDKIKFFRLKLLTQWALECLKQIDDVNRNRFPRDQEKILVNEIKIQLKTVKIDLIQFYMEDLKFIGIILRDYDVGGNVNFNKFLVESLFSSYKTISIKTLARTDKSKISEALIRFTADEVQADLDRYIDSRNKAKIDSYLNIRRNADSLYTIYSTIELLEQTFKGNEISIEEKRLALQRLFHITGEYLKDTETTPNLSSDVKQSLEEKGVPTKALSKYRDTLAHYQVFPLIEGDDNQVKELFDECFLSIREIIMSEIIKIEDSFFQKIIEEKRKESKIDKSVVDRIRESKSTIAVQGLENCSKKIKSEDRYRSMNDETKKFVDEVYQTVQRMKSKDFPVMRSESGSTEKNPKLSNSIIEYIIKSKLAAYDKVHAEVMPSLGTHVEGLEIPHGDVLKITQVIDRLSYKDTSSLDIFDNFLSLPILENIDVQNEKGTHNEKVISSLKKELERYFDVESFKNNDPYGEFKNSKPENLIDLLNNNISGENANKEKLIGFFESIGKSEDNYIPPEEYERLVKDLGIDDNSKEKLLSYSVGWRKEKCVDLLRKNPPALKTIYDNILGGKSIESPVYKKLAVEYSLPEEPQNNEQERVNRMNQKIEELYTYRTRDEFVLLSKVNNPYAVESQIINVYSLSEIAIKKRRENRKKGQKKKFEMKKLRNYLSHGDPLISIKNHKYIADQLVEVKNQKNVKDMLNDPSITPEKIEATLDIMPAYVGVTEIRKLLCPPNESRRTIRSASESCLTWEEIDKFNEVGAENRDPDNIIIDSEKFISSISSEFEANEEKFSNFIALASESEVIGAHISKVNMLTDNHRYLGHLQRVGKVSGMVMHGMVVKNLLGDLMRGDYKDLAINLGFLAGSPVLEKVAETVYMKGAGLILKGSKLFGRSLKFASPFLSRGVTAFIAWDLFTQVKEYRKGDKDALVPIIGDSVQIATDTVEIGVEIAEGFQVLEGASAVTGPIGMTVAAVIFVGTDVYAAVRTVEKIDKYVHLTGWQKFTEGSRAFFGLRPSGDIENLIEEKDANNQAVKNAKSFLKDNPHIQRYVFPSMTLNNQDKKMREVLDNVVFLNRKENDIKWSRTRPDNVEGIDLFCLPKGDWESVPEEGTYHCVGAIGVEYTNDRTGNVTLISLGDGKDTVHSFQGSSNIFVFGDGFKIMAGGNKDDDFIFGEKSVDAVYDSEIQGYIDGGEGSDKIDVGQLAPHYEESKGVGRYQVFADFRNGIVKDTSKVSLYIKNINEFLGRKGGVDLVVSACDTKYVDGRGGENKNYLDIIAIPKDDACSYDTKVTVNPYTRVTNNATSGQFLYFVKGEKGKEAYIELDPSSQSNNMFTFNYALTDVAAIHKSEKNITFSFVEEFYKIEKKIDVNSSFNLTVSGADTNITTYHLIDSTKIVMGQNNAYAMQNTEKPIDSLLKDYSSIADKSQMYVVVHSNNEVLTVGHGDGVVLMNDPEATASHLVGGGGENVFVISSGHENLTLAMLPISDVVIYDCDQKNKIDTLDLREIKEQLKKDIDREINTDVSKIDSDLLINLSLDDASKKEVVKIRLKDALENNWYKRVHIVIDSIFVIKEILDNFELTPQPLIFDDNSKTIYVINPTDVGKGGKIEVKNEIGDYIFARENDALIITNSLSSRVDKHNLYSIALNDFYYGNNQDKMQSLKIEFNDQQIFLRKEIERVNSARNFSELKREVRIDSYKAVMYAIKEQKLFEAIEGNNIGEVKKLIDHGVSINAKNNDRQTPLHAAAKSGNLELVKYLIEEKGAAVDARDLFEEVPLHHAVISGNVEVVKYLIEEKGANVNAEDSNHRVPLHLAAKYNRLEIVKYLIEERGIDINARDYSKKVPLHLAAEYNRLEVVKYLIEEKGAAVDVRDVFKKVPLHYAVISGNLEVVKYLIEEKHADVNAEDGFRRVPLHLAAKYNRLEIVKYLIEEKGADVNVNDNWEKVPLHLAAEDGRLEAVKYLIEEKGVDVNVKDDSGKQTLHYAVISGNLEVVKYLIEEKGADVNVRDDSKKIPLHLAAEYNRLEVVKYLIEEKGADVNVKDDSGKLTLHYAVSSGKLEVVKYLIGETGADVNVRDDNAGVPLLYAAKGGTLELVKYLIEKGADVHARDKYGYTPWHLAVTNGRPEVVKYFVETTADINAQNAFGMIPLDHAASVGNLEMVKYLIEKGARIDLKTNDETAFDILERKGYTDLVHSIVKKLTERLFDAVKYDDLGDVQDLINQGVGVNVKDSDGQTLLHNAARNGKLKVVKYLVEKKHVDINIKVAYGGAPLHLAAEDGRLEVVKYLIEEKGADINAKDDSGKVILHYAVISGNLEVVKYLIEKKGANVNVRDDSGKIPLQLAAKYNRLEVVKYLIEEKGADINVRDVGGKLALHYAVSSGKLEVVKYLIKEKGADVDVKDNGGTTPLHEAIINGRMEIVRYLIEEANANVNVMDSSGLVPLQYAIMIGNLKIVTYLTETKGIDLNVKDEKGQMPLDLATSTGYSDIVEYLERKLNEEREKPRQYKRSHHHSSHRVLTTDSSNQPEIATSNASEKSSWINDLGGSIVKIQESSAPSEAASSNHPIRHNRRKRHNVHSRHEDRVKHRHRRVQKRNVKYQDSHYYIDQPKIATSSGTRPSSWINGLLDWIKEKGGGLVSSVADKFAAKESEDSKSRGIHACSVRLEKMYSATIPNIPQSRESQGVPKGNIRNTSWSGWSSSWEKVTSNVTDAPEMNTTVLNNALILGDLAVRLVNGTRHKQPIHENLLSLREKSMRFIDENMIMRTIQQGREKFGGVDTNMDV